MNTIDCFALLEDAGATDPAIARSRLYTGHAGTLACFDAAHWPQLLADMQAALARGLYAVPLLTYELGGHLLGIDAHAVPGALAQVLLFERCDRLTPPAIAPPAAAWLTVATVALAKAPPASARCGRMSAKRNLPPRSGASTS
jgi:para-aminobenzoate synthetase/4-amino-4-deoxychorismate lyase